MSNEALTAIIAVIAVIVSVGVPVVGYTFKSLNKRIDDLKIDTNNRFEIETQRRVEAHSSLLNVVNLQYSQIKEGLQDVKDELKNIFPR